MGLTEKVKHAAQDVAGKVKETIGKAADDKDLQNEGKGDQVTSRA